MSLFIVGYVALYGGMHVYLLWKLRQAFKLYGALQVVFILFCLLMILGPILSHFMDQWGFVGAARWLSLATYVWMAIVLWFICLAALADLWNALAGAAALLNPAAGCLKIPARSGVLAFSVVILAAGLWGLWEAWDIRLTRIGLKTPLLAPESGPLRIVQISDLHLGLLVGERRLRKVVSLAEGARPDMVVSTGDLVDGSAAHFNHLAELLAGIEPPLGKYAVTGNHEYYAGLEAALAFHRTAGFTLLRGESLPVAEGLRLVGVDDPTGRRMGLERTPEETTLLPGAGKKEFCLLLKHQPRVEDASPGRFDLQLSGHTHRGQMFPFNYLVRLAHPRLSGFFPLGNGASLYISRGTGTWGPPMRVLSPPEVTLIVLEPSGAD